MKRRFAIAMLALLPAIGFAEDAKVEKVRLKTNKGDIVIELNRAKAPVTVENFLSYVKAKHYDGTVFHRVMDGFMIQGGGFAKEGEKLVEKKTKAPIKNESNNGLGNEPYTIAMARTSAPDSATAQFFINVKNNAPLNHSSTGGYAVFGKVVAGTEVVDAIKKVPTGIKTLAMRDDASGQIINQPAENVPTENVVIESATVE